jgi:hypothetical protein
MPLSRQRPPEGVLLRGSQPLTAVFGLIVMAKKTVAKKSPAKKATKKKLAAATKKVAKKTTKKAEAAGPAAEKEPAKKTAKKRVRKTAKAIRLKAYWGVFNQSLRRVALFEFNEKKQADKKAQELSKSGKSPHFVQPVKEVIEDS